MNEYGELFFSSLIQSGDMADYINLGDIESLFKYVKSEREVYKAFEGFIGEYNKMPEIDTFEDMIGYELPETNESPKYYYDKLRERHIKKSLLVSSSQANELLIDENDINGAYEVIQATIRNLELQKLSNKIFDFRDSHKIMAEEQRRKKLPDYGIGLGWETFDDMNGGLRGGDIFSLLARPGQGKTFLLLSSALYAWQKYRKPVLFVSMEMDKVRIFERLSAMYQKVPYDWVKKGTFPGFKRNRREEFLEGLKSLGDHEMPPFIVIDANLTSTVQDVISLAHQLQPASVYVDGAYMLDVKGFHTKDKVGEVCNTLKKEIAGELEIPVSATWQFNRDSTKLKKGEKPGLEHIGYSDVIGQVSSIVAGLFEEESVETIKQKEVSILKGRDGETGSFFINWDFWKMDFTEIPRIESHKIMVTKR